MVMKMPIVVCLLFHSFSLSTDLCVGHVMKKGHLGRSGELGSGHNFVQLALWPWPSNLTVLDLGFLISKGRIVRRWTLKFLQL